MRIWTAMIVMATLAACAPQVPDARVSGGSDGAVQDRNGALNQPPKVGEIELCDARNYRPLIGQPVSATTFPASRNLRVYSVNDIVTNDYIPQRTNVVYGTNGKIQQVFCG